MDSPQYPQHHLQPEPPHRRRFPVLKILGTVLLIMILICGGVVTYVAYNFPRFAASVIRGPLVASVDEVMLPDEQKASIKQNLNRLADAFQDRRISFTQFKTISRKLTEGPFFELITVEAMRYQYAQAHPVMDEARAETMLLFDRFQRGIVENAIPREQIRTILSLAQDPDEPHSTRDQPLTEAELKPFIDQMRKAVEEADIPAEPFTPDFAAEIDRAVSSVLGPGASFIATQPEAAPE